MIDFEKQVYAEGFTMEQFSDGLEIASDDGTLMAFIDADNNIGYYHKCTKIDMDALFRLKALCEEIKSRNVRDSNQATEGCI